MSDPAPSTLWPVMPSATAWRRLAPGLLLMAGVLLLFRDTAQAMVAIWIRSETFAHAFLVPPIVVWLVWRRRDELARLQPRPAPWVLLPMAAVCLLWLLGELASVAAAAQLALVALLVLTVPAVFGLTVARLLLFPLLFLFFAVPIGEFMVPSMMTWTADFAAAAVQASGVPVYREGLQFVIPSGTWSVVEACSGVRYLIASFMVGTLFAYLNFRSNRRRAVFMAVSLAVPIVANWLRAYMIVMLGHLSGNKLAAGVDHIIYGWVFFGIVIGVMFMVGARFAEPDAVVPAAAPQPTRNRRDLSPWSMGIGVLVLLALTQAAFWRLDHQGHLRDAPQLALPAQLGPWSPVPDITSWRPAFQNPSAVAMRSYADGGDAVLVWIGYYRDQGYDRKLVSSGNGLVVLEPDSPWTQVASGTRAPSAEVPIALRTGDVRPSMSISTAAVPGLRVWQTYWIDGRFVTGDARAKLMLAFDRLLGRADDSAVLLIASPVAGSDTGAGGAAADARLSRFVAAHLTDLERALRIAREAP